MSFGPVRHPAVTVSAVPPGARVVLRGDVDLAQISNESLATLVHDVREITGFTAAPVVVDFSEVTFIDSMGLRLVVALNTEFAPNLRLTGVPPRARRLLEITGLDFLLPSPDAPG